MNDDIYRTVVNYLIMVGDLKINAEDVTKETSLRDDLDLDSVESVSAIMDLEDHFKITIEDKLLPTLQTVGDVVSLVESKVATQAESD